MGFFHTHHWKEIARTYAPNVSELGIQEVDRASLSMVQGNTTILWECQDKECRELRQERMLGKIVPTKSTEEPK